MGKEKNGKIQNIDKRVNNGIKRTRIRTKTKNKTKQFQCLHN